MEIWIIGGIIVALMVYASTKIKRSAARAYERETVEVAEFTILKPEDFLSPVETAYAFEAYSKEFGRGDAEEIRQATITVTRSDSAGSQGYSEAESEIDGNPVRVYRKNVEAGSISFEVEMTVLADFEAEYAERVREVMESFKIK
jgi:hypothetical protein